MTARRLTAPQRSRSALRHEHLAQRRARRLQCKLRAQAGPETRLASAVHSQATMAVAQPPPGASRAFEALPGAQQARGETPEHPPPRSPRRHCRRPRQRQNFGAWGSGRRAPHERAPRASPLRASWGSGTTVACRRPRLVATRLSAAGPGAQERSQKSKHFCPACASPPACSRPSHTTRRASSALWLPTTCHPRLTRRRFPRAALAPGASQHAASKETVNFSQRASGSRRPSPTEMHGPGTCARRSRPKEPPGRATPSQRAL